MEKTDQEKFFDLLDRYLIADLETMLNKTPNWESGGLGYPAIQTIISGMELLGKVLSGQENELAFNYIWDNYLTETDDAYKNIRLKKIFYFHVRQGTAHYFLIKSKLSLTKQGTYHLQEIQGHLNIDLKVLYEHFKKVYNNIRMLIVVEKEPDVVARFKLHYPKLIEELKTSDQEVNRFLGEIRPESTMTQITTQSGVQTLAEPPSLSSNASVTLPPEEWLKGK